VQKETEGMGLFSDVMDRESTMKKVSAWKKKKFKGFPMFFTFENF
jgi:hypothetical protein